MDSKDFSKLQNGSDIRGVALEGIEGENVNLTAEAVRAIGQAFILWLEEQGITSPTIMIGRDSRLSGESLMKTFVEGAYDEKVRKMYDTGISSTPAMFMATVLGDNPADASVMITASHLPFNRNGFKFFTRKGGLDKGDISRVLQIASEIKNVNISEREPEKLQFIDIYANHLVEYIRKSAQLGDLPLKGMKIIVDAGNGAGGFFADKVLAVLGADTEGSQFLDPDGRFPNHIPNPEDKTAMKSICDAVKACGADLGVIFDTDVDRAAIVDREGNPINRNNLIALISSVVLREHPGSTIVTDSITSDGLAEFIQGTLGGVHHRFKRGYKNVINESIRINSEGGDSWLAIETSGHAALRENYFFDDGAFLVAKLLVEAARLHSENKDIADSIKTLRQPLESKEYRYKILEEDFKSYGKMILDSIQKAASEMPGWEIVSPNYEGIRVRCSLPEQSGWFLLRMSLHDPVLPLNIESDVKGGVEAIYDKVKGLLEGYNIKC